MAFSFATWFKSFVSDPLTTARISPKIWEARFAALQANIALSPSERLASAQHYKLTLYQEDLQESAGVFCKEVLLHCQQEINKPWETSDDGVETRENILSAVAELQLIAQVCAKTVRLANENVQSHLQSLQDQLERQLSTIRIRFNSLAPATREMIKPWPQQLALRVQDIEAQLQVVRAGLKKNGHNHSTTSFQFINFLSSLLRFPRQFFNGVYFVVYSIRQALSPKSPRWLRVLLAFIYLPIEAPFFLAAVMADLLLARTFWQRYLSYVFMLGIIITSIVFSSILLMFIPALMPTVFYSYYQNTGRDYRTLHDFLDAWPPWEHPDMAIEPFHLQHLMRLLKKFGPELQQQSGLPYIDYQDKLRDLIKKSELTGKDKTLFQKIVQDTRIAARLMQQQTPRSQPANVRGMVVGVLLIMFAVFSLLFPALLPAWLLLSTMMLMFGLSSLRIVSSIQNSIETHFWNEMCGRGRRQESPEISLESLALKEVDMQLEEPHPPLVVVEPSDSPLVESSMMEEDMFTPLKQTPSFSDLPLPESSSLRSSPSLSIVPMFLRRVHFAIYHTDSSARSKGHSSSLPSLQALLKEAEELLKDYPQHSQLLQAYSNLEMLRVSQNKDIREFLEQIQQFNDPSTSARHKPPTREQLEKRAKRLLEKYPNKEAHRQIVAAKEDFFALPDAMSLLPKSFSVASFSPSSMGDKEKEKKKSGTVSKSSSMLKPVENVDILTLAETTERAATAFIELMGSPPFNCEDSIEGIVNHINHLEHCAEQWRLSINPQAIELIGYANQAVELAKQPVHGLFNRHKRETIRRQVKNIQKAVVKIITLQMQVALQLLNSSESITSKFAHDMARIKEGSPNDDIWQAVNTKRCQFEQIFSLLKQIYSTAKNNYEAFRENCPRETKKDSFIANTFEELQKIFNTIGKAAPEIEAGYRESLAERLTSSESKLSSTPAFSANQWFKMHKGLSINSEEERIESQFENLPKEINFLLEDSTFQKEKILRSLTKLRMVAAAYIASKEELSVPEQEEYPVKSNDEIAETTIATANKVLQKYQSNIEKPWPLSNISLKHPINAAAEHARQLAALQKNMETLLAEGYVFLRLLRAPREYGYREKAGFEEIRSHVRSLYKEAMWLMKQQYALAVRTDNKSALSSAEKLYAWLEYVGTMPDEQQAEKEKREEIARQKKELAEYRQNFSGLRAKRRPSMHEIDLLSFWSQSPDRSRADSPGGRNDAGSGYGSPAFVPLTLLPPHSARRQSSASSDSSPSASSVVSYVPYTPSRPVSPISPIVRAGSRSESRASDAPPDNEEDEALLRAITLSEDEEEQSDNSRENPHNSLP